jgi:hypothetical protein
MTARVLRGDERDPCAFVVAFQYLDYLDSLKSRKNFPSFCGSVDSDGA